MQPSTDKCQQGIAGESQITHCLAGDTDHQSFEAWRTARMGSARLAVSLTVLRLFLHGVSLSVPINQPSGSGDNR